MQNEIAPRLVIYNKLMRKDYQHKASIFTVIQIMHKMYLSFLS